MKIGTADDTDYDWQSHLQAELVLNATNACEPQLRFYCIYKRFSNFVKL
jgi:hypothetical protein